MLDLSTCKQILNEGEQRYSDEEVKTISELLWHFAQLTVQALEEGNQTTQSLQKNAPQK